MREIHDASLEPAQAHHGVYLPCTQCKPVKDHKKNINPSNKIDETLIKKHNRTHINKSTRELTLLEASARKDKHCSRPKTRKRVPKLLEQEPMSDT